MISNTDKVILNLGCGNATLPGEIGVDIINGPMVDIVTDLNQYPLPFDDNSVDIVRSAHCFEHLDNIVTLMEDIHRFLKPDGILEFTVPHVSNIGFFRDPTHKRAFTLGTMDYFVRGEQPVKYTQIEFEYIEHRLCFGSGLQAMIGAVLAKMSERRYEKYYCWKYPAFEIYYKMRALK